MPASALMNVMTGAARKAGRSLSRDFGEVERLQVSIKGPANFVSAADHRAEDILYRELSRARPDYTFLMEERGSIDGADKSHRWIVDPLDGTTNFLHGLPLFCIAIGLEREGHLVAGLIYLPVLDELYTAERGKGAFLNDRRIRVSARRTLNEAVVATSIPHRGRTGHARFRREMEMLSAETTGIRRSGAAAVDLAWTAAGRYDAYWEHDVQPWDIAAGIVILREAGGIATDIDGQGNMLSTGSIVAGVPSIQRALLNKLANIDASKR
ncbi:MAG: inositol monophosphatase family protein [Hyphomicrobiaceae bacterium]